MAQGIESGCECGRGLRVLKGLKGRAHDFIVAADGRFVHGQVFTHILVFEEGIEKYQIIQEDPNHIRVVLVTTERYSRDSEKRVRRAAAGYLGEDSSIEFEYVESIPLTISGKHRWIVSKVSQRSPT